MWDPTHVFLICAVLCAFLISLPAIQSISVRTIRPTHKSLKHTYEDDDGTASFDSQHAYETAVRPRLLLIFAIFGTAASLSTAVIRFVVGGDAIVFWLPFGIWLLVSLQCLALILERGPRRRFVLSNWLCLSGLLLLAVEIIRVPSSSNATWTTLTTLRLQSAALLVGFALFTPRRPKLWCGTGVVDGQYTVPLLQRLAFSWIYPLLRKARQSSVASLHLHDLPFLHLAARTSSLHLQFSSHAQHVVIWKRIFRSHKREIIGHYAMAVLHSVSQLASQWVMYHLLRTLELRTQDEVIGRLIYALVFALGFSIVFAAWLETQILWIVNAKLVVSLRSELTAMLYAKLLSKKNVVALPQRTELEKREGTDDIPVNSTEDVINLVALDTKRITDLMGASYLIPGAISKLMISSAFLVQLIGWQSVLAGFAALLLVNPFNIYCSRLMNAAQIKLMRIRDSKMSTISEVLRSIRQIKFTATEMEWFNRIKAQRDDELRTLWYTFVLRTALVGFWQIGPVLFSTVSLGVYSILNGSLLPSIAFTTIAILSQIEESLAVLPKLTLQAYQASVSFQRIQRYGAMPDQTDYISDEQDQSGIRMTDASFGWPTDEKSCKNEGFVLRDLSVTLPAGRLSVICGDTGSGKTLLLRALTGQAELLSGSLSLPTNNDATGLGLGIGEHQQRLGRTIAYVSQDIWIENATIKDNILFDLPLSDERYQQTVSACSLSQDLAIWPDGDETEVGVGGVNLSGGQKWRLSLARALYSRASVVIIDDIFSALDAHVGRHVWKHAMIGPLTQGRTCVLATHHVDLCLSGADLLLRLSEGRIVEVNDLAARRDRLVDTSSTDAMSDLANDTPERSSSEEDRSIDEGTASLVEETSDTTVSPASPSATKQPEKFVTEESRETGAVRLATYAYYVSATGGILMSVFVLGAHLGYTASGFSRTWWLSVWTRHSEQDQHHASISLSTQNIGWSIPSMPTIRGVGLASADDQHFYLWVYVATSVLVCIVGIVKFISVLLGSIRASRQLFDNFTSSILHAPIAWLDRVPSGRIMNRFTADFETIDNSMADGIGFFLTMTFQLFAIVIAGMVVSPYIIIVAGFLFGISVLVAKLYLPAARDIKRLDSVARSPILDRFQSTIAGLDTIRAHGKGSVYLTKMMKDVDDYARTSFYRTLVNLWLMLRLNLIGAIFTTVVAIVIVVRREIDASLAGFALSFALQYTVAIEWAIRQFSATQLAMNSTERILEYSSMETEKAEGLRVSAAWPAQGHVHIRNLSVGYKPGEDILKEINMQIEPGMRVGVVGRTGAGKSTLSLAFFRFLEANAGCIEIDGIDIAGVSLRDLRARLAIIPQDPVLFTGDIRTNLDPFNDHTDEVLCDALESVHFTNHDKSRQSILAQLSQPISQGGANLSQGQKQLLCMARAVVARQKLLIMDEATSSVDMETDAMIQKSIRQSFQGCTLIVIAHRLSTLADFDRIFVLDHGRVVESGDPRELWRSGGAFHQLVQESGERSALERRFEHALSG